MTSLFSQEQCNNPSAMVAAIAQQARLLGLKSPRELEMPTSRRRCRQQTIELTQEEWVAQFSTPLRLPKPGKNLKTPQAGPGGKTPKDACRRRNRRRTPRYGGDPNMGPRCDLPR